MRAGNTMAFAKCIAGNVTAMVFACVLAFAVVLLSPVVAFADNTPSGGADDSKGDAVEVVQGVDSSATENEQAAGVAAQPAEEPAVAFATTSMFNGGSDTALAGSDNGCIASDSSKIAASTELDAPSPCVVAASGDVALGEGAVDVASAKPGTLVPDGDSAEETAGEQTANGALSALALEGVTIIDDELDCPRSDTKTGAIELYDSHPYEVAFTALKGGSIVAGDPAKISSEGGFTSIVQIGQDSLSGMSYKITALSDDGYHFVHWCDALTGEVISTDASLVLERPEQGWHDEWSIEAVFAPNVYVVLLDQNGGKSIAEGTNPDEAVYYDVWARRGFKLPKNGTDELWFARAGYEFAGWNTVPSPNSMERCASAMIADGQTINSTLEKLLVDRGFLVLDWSDGLVPLLTLYAQWTPVQATITYQAEMGGTVVFDSDEGDLSASTFSETLDASTGLNVSDDEKVGPSGAYASTDARHHFTGWDVVGTAREMTDAESTSDLLSSTVVTRLSYYSDINDLGEEYHTLVFTASFSPNTYVITYGANGGSGSIESESITYGSKIKAASAGVKRDGYKLASWNLAADGSGATVALGSTIDSVTIDSLIDEGYLDDANHASTVLYAQWEAEEVVPSPEPVDDPVVPVDGGEMRPTDDEVTESESTPDASGKEETSGGAVARDDAAQAADEGMPSEETPVVIGSSTNVPVLENAVTWFVATVADAAEVGSEAVGQTVEEAVEAVAQLKDGLLATPGKQARLGGGPVVVRSALSEGAIAIGDNGNPLSQLATPEGMRAAGATVAVVATVGAVAGFVGIGVSVAGAAMLSAGAAGAAGAAGLTTVADLAADLAAAAAAGAAATNATSRRKRREEDGVES